jgi:HD-like signal output (HDOD) protein
MKTADVVEQQHDALERIRRRVAALGGLPTLPAVAAEVLRLTRDPKSTVKDIAALIAKDPPLTGRILKVANSAFYGLSQQVGSLSVACVLLGMKNITSIVTSVSILRAVRFEKDVGGFTREAFWEHSGACGRACEILGKRLKLDVAAQAFVTGLIHDLGKTVLDAVFHEDFERVLKLAAAERLPFHEAERRVLGTDHAAIGSWLAETWKLPTEIAQAIAHHHGPPCDPKEMPLGAVLQLADAAVRGAGLGFAGFAPPPARENMSAWPVLAGVAWNWDEAAAQLAAAFHGVKEFLHAAAS